LTENEVPINLLIKRAVIQRLFQIILELKQIYLIQKGEIYKNASIFEIFEFIHQLFLKSPVLLKIIHIQVSFKLNK
jgi:hypothetical protein